MVLALLLAFHLVMNLLVPRQYVRSVKGFTAHITAEWFHPCVHFHVSVQVVDFEVGLEAHLTNKRFHS